MVPVEPVKERRDKRSMRGGLLLLRGASSVEALELELRGRRQRLGDGDGIGNLPTVDAS
jgi:hypothetical protein